MISETPQAELIASSQACLGWPVCQLRSNVVIPDTRIDSALTGASPNLLRITLPYARITEALRGGSSRAPNANRSSSGRDLAEEQFRAQGTRSRGLCDE